MKIIITGGLGFIGSSLTRKLSANKSNIIFNIDKITKASTYKSMIPKLSKSKNYNFIKADISNHSKTIDLFNIIKPDLVIHAAAESHVDNSIKNPSKFIKSNINGTYNLLEAIRKNSLISKTLFFYISTDEVYGSLSQKGGQFYESNKFLPNSPYSASKSSSDLLVRAWNKTYGIKTLTSNCCNNYGPWQYHEKLIPLTIKRCLEKKPIPIYGNGKNIREWIHVDDHSQIIIKLKKFGKYGEAYNIGSGYEISNIKLVKTICLIFNKLTNNKYNYENLITFVEDRKAHDFRYSVSNKKLLKCIGKYKFKQFETELEKTIKWFIIYFNAKI